jgi:hypothetical protein
MKPRTNLVVHYGMDRIWYVIGQGNVVMTFQGAHPVPQVRHPLSILNYY